MEKIKLILQGFYNLITLFIKVFSYIGYSLSVLFVKIIDTIAAGITLLMQKAFTGLFDAAVFFGKTFYYIASVVINFVISLVYKTAVFIVYSLNAVVCSVYQLLHFTFNFIKNFIYSIIPFLVSLPFRACYFYFYFIEKQTIFFQKLKKSFRARRWSFFKHQSKYKHYLKNHIWNKITAFIISIKRTLQEIFIFIKLFIFKIILIFKKVIYNIYYAIKNVGSFIANLILMLSLLLKSSFLAIISIFSKSFWNNFWDNFFNWIYNLRIFLKKLLKRSYFESRIFIKHSMIFIRSLLLFVWLDILNFKKMGMYIKNNLIKTSATLVFMFFLMYGFVLMAFYPTQFDKLTKKHADAFFVLNTPNLLSEIRRSELFQPLVYYKEFIKVDSGSNLYNSLLEKGINVDNASEVVDTLKGSFDLRKINPNWIINTVVVSSTEWDSKKIQKLTMPIDNRIDLIVEADKNFNYMAYKQEKKLTRYMLRRKTLVKDSIYASAVSAGISPNIAMEVFKVLSWDIDFQREIKENNTLEVIFECIYNENGELVTCDNILFASIVGDRTTSFYKFNGGYYHESGRSVVKTLVKTPINNARLSSSFGLRTHPVMGYTAVHKGVDFAAPTGTPIYASGVGTIEMMYRSASYGNYIRIRHNPYLSSAYAHMSGFAKGLKVGDKVSQWQLIGYVGATGIATGPHLHYEILINGKQVNPLTVKMPSAMKLDADKLQEFNNYKATFNNVAIKISTRGKIVSPLGESFNGNFETISQ
ncbi:MAG: peptidoglycan DD-metalloendopeptidase family protein [Alphaproteobacteria bacterium]|nr:peptidoglycan DD-metalloendopeptidase family protein [Alphaproteobacteria bacterium]